MKKQKLAFINSFGLHIIAMSLMLLDHMWATIMQGNNWMTYLGRLAYPLFAFMLVEGYFHSRNLKKYFLRLLVWALISEIPFNLMLGGYWLDPFDQNVIWTLLIGLSCIHLTQLSKKKFSQLYAENNKENHSTYLKFIRVYLPSFMAGVLVFSLGCILALIALVDYYHYGILMIAVFYVFRGQKWPQRLGQLLGMIIINVVLFKGMYIEVKLFKQSFEIIEQGFAVLALIPIWLYNGEKGYSKKAFQIFCYLFYPLHILILSLIALYY